MTATWTKLMALPDLQRSSQCLTVIGSNAYIYGGELQPRHPVDANVNIVDLQSDHASIDTITPTSDTAPPRVGSASAALGYNMYMFSGRGGLQMAPIEEHGMLWVLETFRREWTRLWPSDTKAAYPEGRSYHAMASDGDNTIYVHAGCPEKGRLADLWAFNINNKAWKRLADAPAPSRGGSSIAFSGGHLYRMNGFDGNTEQGGALDSYDPSTDTWTTISYSPDGKAGPIARSVCSLQALNVAGKPSLVTFFGESNPSNLGHAGAGKMLSDIWLFDIQSQEWHAVEASGQTPPARGWFDADVVPGRSVIVVTGGLAESNVRLDDLWRLEF